MSFALTTSQIINRSKTVTRRLGWKKLKIGERVWAVEKCLGLKKGQTATRLAVIEIVGMRCERLDTVTKNDVIAEGFPDWSPQEFIQFICKRFKIQPDCEVRRIEFIYIDTSKKVVNRFHYLDEVDKLLK